MDLAKPELLWLLLLVPAAWALAWWAWRQRLAAITAWAARGLWNRLLPGYEKRRLQVSAILCAVAVFGVCLALAQPRWGAGSQQVEREGVDIVFVLDTSLSMATTDVAPYRLFVAQSLIRRLVEDLPGNRVALVQAEGDGIVMVPLTGDTAVVDLLLDAVLPGSAPMPGTELAPSLERAAELFPEEGSKHQVMVVLSDGEDHGSSMDQARKLLRDRGIVVHSVGVGTREGKPLEVPGEENAQLEYKRDSDGNVVVSRLVEATLEDLARDTGGIYVRATSAAADMGPVVQKIQGMETRGFGSEVVSTLEERFQWPLALAILALICHLIIPPFTKPAEHLR